MLINPFPPHLLVDRFHRPYFLTDEELTLERLRALLVDDDPAVRACWVGPTMRHAGPDDAIVLIGLPAIRELWPSVERYLGRSRAYWTWLLPIAGEFEPVSIR